MIVLRKAVDMNTLLKVKNLSKHYQNKEALKNISFDVKRGEIIGIIGHNGAGKTTLINTLVGIHKQSSGTYEYIFDHKTLYDHIGVQMQSSFYEPHVKVKDICMLYKKLRKSQVDVDGLLKEFDLLKEKNNYVARLSGGNKQRLSILLTLLHQPEIIFLDELTTGLDPMARRMVWEILKDINQNKETTIVLTSHFLDEIEYLADRVMILNQGEMVYYGGVSQAIEDHCQGQKDIFFSLKEPLAAFKIEKYKPSLLPGARYKISTKEDTEVLLDLIQNIGIDQLEVKSPSLEDVFLKQVGYTLDEKGGIVHV